jgi:hypothetical protein
MPEPFPPFTVELPDPALPAAKRQWRKAPIESYDWDWPRAEREFRKASSRSRALIYVTRSPPEDRQNVIAFMPDSMYALSTDAVPSPLGCAQPPRTARKIDHLSAEWILSLLDEFHGIKAFVATKGAAA